MASYVKLVNKGFEARKQIGAQTLHRMRLAAENIKRGVKADVGKPYPPASRPGKFPKRRTGKFQRSIKFKVVNQTRNKSIILYSDDPKAFWLEYGTRFMAPRPTFRLAMRKYKREFAKAFRQGGSASRSGVNPISGENR